jgi:hypothetical protein
VKTPCRTTKTRDECRAIKGPATRSRRNRRENRDTGNAPGITASQIQAINSELDTIEKLLDWLKRFRLIGSRLGGRPSRL